MKKAIILLSGGLDSTTLLKILEHENQYNEIHALSFSYNQRHIIELEKVKQIIASSKIAKHIIIKLDIAQLGGSSLVDNTIAIPQNQINSEKSKNIPNTYVPARNTIFISHAFGYAEIIGGADIYIGANAVDYSNYPDCRADYVEQFNALISIATKYNDQSRIKIYAPLMRMTKAEIIKKGLELGVDYSITTSCYDPGDQGEGCGVCDACILRIKGFDANCIKDPAKYK